MKLYRVARRKKGTERAFTWVPDEPPAYVIRDHAQAARAKRQELDDTLAKYFDHHQAWEFVVQEVDPDWTVA